MRRLLLIPFAALLFGCAGAGARATTPAGIAIQRAENFWRAEPCEGNVAVQFADTTADGKIGEAFIEQCRIVLDSAVYPNQDAMAADWPRFCAVVTHEIGHLLLGYDYFAATNPRDPAHSPDPADIMSNGPSAGLYPRECFPAILRTRRYYRSEVRGGRILTIARYHHRPVGITVISPAAFAKATPAASEGRP